MKSRKNSPSASGSGDRDQARKGGLLPHPGETEATRPRSRRDEVQKGPGSASADTQMTSDGGYGDERERNRR